VNASRALWKSDGTPGGTVAVRSVIANATPLRVGNELFFAGYDNIGGTELWKSDGTTSGTGLAADVYPGAGGSMPGDLTAFASDSGLERLDAGQTTLLTSGAAIHDLTVAGGLLYFGHGAAVARTDGTAAGTVDLATILGQQICSTFGCTNLPSNPRFFTALGEQVLFVADATSGFELWKTNGTAAGTSRLANVGTGWGGEPLGTLLAANGVVYFAAWHHELWRSDGTAAGTTLVADIGPASDPAELTDLGGTLVFVARAASGGRELWTSDGTAGGTARIIDLNPGAADASPAGLTVVGGRLYFAATEPAGG